MEDQLVAISLEQLKAAVDSASAEARAAYVSFTIFALYFAITVGATSHEELLRGSQVTMPALGVGLPIVGFYVLVPPLFLLFHALLLIQLNVLASRVRRLKEATSDAGELSGPPFVLSQFLLGNIRGFLLRPMVYATIWVSLILLPIGVLIFVQVRFLPYHSDWVTWWHRILIVVDLGLVWLLWPQILKPTASIRVALATPRHHQRLDQRTNSSRGGPARGIAPMVRRGLGHAGLVALTAVVLFFSLALATLPRNADWPIQITARHTVCPKENGAIQQAAATTPPPVYQACRLTWHPPTYWASVSLSPAVVGGPSRRVSCLSYLLFEAPTTPLNMRRNLQVRSADLVQAPPRDVVTERLDHDQAWKEYGRGLDLRGRDLRYADLSSSDLRKADLRGADLLGANLAFADLRYARAGDVAVSDFDGCKRELRDDGICFNRLSSANLQNADLRYSRFRKADLRQANLSYTNLQGIDLAGARLDDALLVDASLDGAELQSARLDRADLRLAGLAGSDLSQASLHDTCLERADLTFAHLKKAALVGSDLSGARLDGAFLPESNLTGAVLTKAYLAGADLRRAKLDRVTLGDGHGEAFLGWTDMRGIDKPTLRAVFGSVLTRAYEAQFRGVTFDVFKLDDEKVGPSPVWTEVSEKYPVWTEVSERHKGTLRALFGSVRHDIMPEVLPTADPEEYERNLASLLAGKACRPDVSPFIVHGLVKRIIDDIHMSGEYRAHHRKVAKRLLSQLVGANGHIEEVNLQADGSLAERLDAGCLPATDIPQHMRINLRAIMVLLL